MKNYYPVFAFVLFYLFSSLPTQAQWYKFKWRSQPKEAPVVSPPVIKIPESAEDNAVKKEAATPPKIKAENGSKLESNVSTSEKETEAKQTSTPASTPIENETSTGNTTTYPKISGPENTQPVIHQTENGQVNWTEQYIEAKGFAIIDMERFKNPAQAKLMAIRGATVVAQRNLLEIANGVKVIGETTVQDMMTINDEIITRVEGIVRGAQLVGEPVEKQGYIEVIMRMPLYAQNGLAAAVHSEASAIANNYKTAPGYETPENQVTAQSKNNSAPTGVAFKLNGKTIDPSMFPLVVDEKGNLVFDLTKLYDPKSGLFPKVVQTTKEVFEAANYEKGLEVINVIDSFDGKIVVSEKESKKINWGKVGRIAASVGSFLLAVI